MNVDRLTRYFENIRDTISPHKEPGFCSAIIQNGEIVHSINHGLASIEHQSPLTGDSLFYLASESKQFTAACILHLVRDKKLSLNQDVRDIVIETAHFPAKISIQNLLNHTSGIPDYFQYINSSINLSGGHENDYFDNRHILKVIDNCNLAFRPNTRHVYSNSNYIVLAEVVKKVSGSQLANYAKKHIFKPLGMTSTLYDNDRGRVIKNRVCSYSSERKTYRTYLKNSCTVGDGGVLSSINDLAKWEANYHNNSLLPANVVRGLTKRSKLSTGELLSYANGLEISARESTVEYIYHGGAFEGFLTDIIKIPSHKTSIIYLCNNDGIGYTPNWYRQYLAV